MEKTQIMLAGIWICLMLTYLLGDVLRIYSLEQAAEAHRYVESGQKTGQVVILVDGGRAQ